MARTRINGREAFHYSAICETGVNGDRRLCLVKVGYYPHDSLLRKEVESRHPPEVLRPYTVLGIVATFGARERLLKKSQTMGIPIAEEPEPLKKRKRRERAKDRRTSNGKISPIA